MSRNFSSSILETVSNFLSEVSLDFFLSDLASNQKSQSYASRLVTHW